MALVDESEVYNEFAPLYDAIETLPQSALYQQLVEYALGPDCTGEKVLDLGGGTGLHARKAIDRHADFVDLVDVSPNMLEHGKATDERLGREKGRIRWYLGDITKPLESQLATALLQTQGYDVVMVNWTFDHAETMEELEMMWANTAAFCKPGGKLISIRIASPWAKTDGRYGVTLSDQDLIPGGCKYTYTTRTDPEFTASATTMKASWNFEESKALASKYGFVEFSKIPDEEMDVVKQDMDYWQMHLHDPVFICVTARKRVQ